MTMDFLALIEQVRGHYVRQFEQFIDREEMSCARGAAEVKFEIPELPSLFRSLTCVDFVRNESGPEGVLFEPEHILTFDAFSCSIRTMQVDLEALRWDCVVIHHDLPGAPSLNAWFDRWFDPDDERYDPNARLGGVIHFVTISTGSVSIDFGTSPAKALVELLELLEVAGARRVTVNDQAPHLD